MSYRTVSSKRPYTDEWLQVQCDGCGALGPRVEVTIPRRGHPPDSAFKLAKQVAGFAQSYQPWPYDAQGMLVPTPVSARRRKGTTIHDLCQGCAFKARVARLIADFGGPFGPPPDDHDQSQP